MQRASANSGTTLISILTTCIVGCTAEAQRHIRFPDLAHPGPTALQRAEAIQHDPYPLNDIAPEIVGGRPLSYQQPLNEVERARLVPTRPVLIQPMPAPGASVNAPPVVSSPYAVAPPQPAAPLTPVPPTVVASPVPPAQAGFGPPAYPLAPAPFVSPYSATPAPVVTSPYPGATTPPVSPFPIQQRAPY
jgi:hypothetical protein